MARKVSRCLRKNYKKKVKANAKSEKTQAESANEIAALFNGVGDLAAAKRTIAAANNNKGVQRTATGKVLGKAHAAASSKKATAAVGGKKKLADNKKKLRKKTLFGDNDDEDDDEADSASDDDDDEEDENEDDNNGGALQLPDVNALNTLEQLSKYRTLLRKQQVREKMTLREHVRELEKKKASMRGGKNVAEDLRREKRDLGKYIKQLEDEQKLKHAMALHDVEIRLAQVEDGKRDPFAVAAERSKARNRLRKLGASASAQGIYQSGMAQAFLPNLASQQTYSSGNRNNAPLGFSGADDIVAADELQNMFAHLM